MAVLSKDHSDGDLVKYLDSCYREAEDARTTRDSLTEANYDMYHMRHDFSHKTAGQSTEILSKQRMAVESTKSFFQQALADITEWFDISYKDNSVDEGAMLLKPHEAKKLMQYQFTQSSYFSHVGLCVQRGLLGGVMISKTHGQLIPKHKFEVKKEGKGKTFKKHVIATDDKTWQLKQSRIRNEDFHPDPTGKGLYIIEDIYADMHEVKAKAKGENAIYDMEMVNQLSMSTPEDALHAADKARETGQDIRSYGSDHRPQVHLKEYWGDIVGSDGELLFENIVMTIANDRWVIQKPTPNPNWHQKHPYTCTALLEVDGAVWPIALMDAATKHNHTLIEMLNLILDASFRKVHAPSQIRVSDLANPEQIANGIPPGTTLKVKSTLPPGAKVMEPLESTDVPNDALNVMNIIDQEFNASALTSALRSGSFPDRAVKATEVVEQSQSLTGIFQGIAKNIEAQQIAKELELGWMTIAQNLDRISKDELISLFGIERGSEISQADPQDIFVQTVNGYKFQVFGITQTLAKAQDFRKLTTMLQTISSSELLIEKFVESYDMGKLLGEILTTLNIDKHKIELPEQPPQGPDQDAFMPTQDQASTPDAGATGSTFAEIFGGDLAAVQGGGPAQ
jgi:hypothetical protein